MQTGVPAARITSALLLLTWLVACSDGSDRRSTGTSAAQWLAQERAGPQASGDVAADGLVWLNYRRAQAGLPALARDARLDRAAAVHAAYQQLNNVISHDEVFSRPGYSGASATERLRAAGYPLESDARADGEVIAATAAPDGFAAAEGLLGAIYHRNLMLEPRFDLAGAGAAHRAGGYHWLNLNFVASRTSAGLNAAGFIVWPMPDQQGVPTRVFSDQETPDPVDGRDAVGYPLSVHANLGALLEVQHFILREPGGAAVPALLLSHQSDRDTLPSAAAVIALTRLRSATRYEAEFAGTIDGVPVQQRWFFTTR